MPLPDGIADYLREHYEELGTRILKSHSPLHAIDDPPSPIISRLLRRPYSAQTLAIMGLVRRWQQARAGAVIAECGTGKTLILLAAVQTQAEDRPFTARAMVPPQLAEKWCREAILTLPRVRVFIIDGLRMPTNSNSHHGVNEVMFGGSLESVPRHRGSRRPSGATALSDQLGCSRAKGTASLGRRQLHTG